MAGARPPATTSPPSDPTDLRGPRAPHGDGAPHTTERHHPWETRAHPPGQLRQKESTTMAKPAIRKPKKKANPLKAAKVENIDYKDAALLRKFISDRGKIRARRVTGVTVQEQRLIANAVKNAREMACCRTRARPADRFEKEPETMKVILTHEVTGLGTAGDVVDVKDGYARNFLFRRGLATAWTKGGQKQVDAIAKGREVREVKSLEEAQVHQGQPRVQGRHGHRARRHGRPPLRRRLHRRHRRRRQGRRRPVARQAQDRGPDPDQDHRHALRAGAPPPRGAGDRRARRRRRLIQPLSRVTRHRTRPPHRHGPGASSRRAPRVECGRGRSGTTCALIASRIDRVGAPTYRGRHGAPQRDAAPARARPSAAPSAGGRP